MSVRNMAGMSALHSPCFSATVRNCSSQYWMPSSAVSKALHPPQSPHDRRILSDSSARLPGFFLVLCLAEADRAPFDPPEAEAQLVAGYGVECFLVGFAPVHTHERS